MADIITRGKFEREELNVLADYFIEQVASRNYEVSVTFGVFRDTEEAKSLDRQVITARGTREGKEIPLAARVSVFNMQDLEMLECFSQEELNRENPLYSQYFIQSAMDLAHKQFGRIYGLSEKDVRPKSLYGYGGLVLLDEPLILNFGINFRTNMKIGDIYTLVCIDKK